MIFLMNDVVLDLDLRRLTPPMSAGRFRALELPFVLQLGRELYASRPLVHREDRERASRLAALVVCKAPEINAALFCVPAAGCAPTAVEVRLAQLDVAMVAALFTRQAARTLDPAAVDAEVWRRMAA